MIAAMKVFEKLLRASLWVALAILIVMVLLALVKPSNDVAEDEP